MSQLLYIINLLLLSIEVSQCLTVQTCNMFLLTARTPTLRFFFLRFFFFCVVILWGLGGCNNVLCLRCYPLTSVNTVAQVCNSSVNTLHVTLHTSCVLRWAHFMLRCTRLLYFGEGTSCCVAQVFRSLVNTLHVTLHMFFVLRRTHFMLRCTFVLRWRHFMLRCKRLLFFGEHTSCCVAHVFCSLVNTEHMSCYVAHVFCTSLHKDCAPCSARQSKGSCPDWNNSWKKLLEGL